MDEPRDITTFIFLLRGCFFKNTMSMRVGGISKSTQPRIISFLTEGALLQHSHEHGTTGKFNMTIRDKYDNYH